jgi:adenylate cyclase
MGAHYFRNCYIGMISISFLSNAVVVASITWLSGFFIAPEQRYLSRIIDNDPVVLFSSRILPFLIVMPFIYLVISPGFAADFVRKIADSTRLQKRALQLPILVSLLATSGWVIGIFSFTAILFFRPGIPRQFIWDSLIFTWVLAAMALLICYYSLEFINRRLILPKISEQIKPEALMGAFNLSIRMRLVLHLLATVGLPLIILARIIFFLDAHKPADFEYLATRDLVLLLLLIVFIGVLLTWLQSKFISAPLREMQSATTRIQTGEFTTSVSVTSGDEIGTLAADINAMARGLAEREEMRETFGRIVDPSVRDYLLGSGQLDGELRVISVLFCDLAGFTGFSERNSPAEVVKFLNRYFELAQNVVSAHGGIINKFIGDAFMAIFNAPVPLKTHADAAIAAALQFRASYIGLSDEKPGIRLGIHSGEVLAGRIGSEQRQEYTVIGDAVNVAARIEALGKKVGENLLLSDATAELATKESVPQLRKIGKIMLRGKSSGTVVYAL